MRAPAFLAERLRSVKRYCSLFLISFLISSLLAARPAKAITLGDAALTVAVSTVTGAVLGVSTLPFYEESSKNTKNIFYGAAIGAAAGVFIAAYAGVQEGAEEEETASVPRKAADTRFAFSRQLTVEKSGALAKAGRDVPLVWSPIADFRF